MFKQSYFNSKSCPSRSVIYYKFKCAVETAKHALEKYPPLFRQEIWKERRCQIIEAEDQLNRLTCDRVLLSIIQKHYFSGTRGYFWSSYNRYLKDLGNILQELSKEDINKIDNYNDYLFEYEESIKAGQEHARLEVEISQLKKINQALLQEVRTTEDENERELKRDTLTEVFQEEDKISNQQKKAEEAIQQKIRFYKKTIQDIDFKSEEVEKELELLLEEGNSVFENMYP